MTSFYQLASDHPGATFLVTSGDRPRGGQPGPGNPYPVAPEGKSFHQRYAYGLGSDEALDVFVNGREIAKAIPQADLNAHGLQTPVPNDPPHLTKIGWNG